MSKSHYSLFIYSISNNLTTIPAIGIARKIHSNPAILALTNRAKNIITGLRLKDVRLI